MVLNRFMILKLILPKPGQSPHDKSEYDSRQRGEAERCIEDLVKYHNSQQML